MKQKQGISKKKVEAFVDKQCTQPFHLPRCGGLERALTTVSWESCWCGWSGPGLVLGVCNGGADAEVIKRRRDENDYCKRDVWHAARVIVTFAVIPSLNQCSYEYIKEAEETCSPNSKGFGIHKRQEETFTPMLQLRKRRRCNCAALWTNAFTTQTWKMR